MIQTRLILFFAPGKHHINSFLSRAEIAKDLGLLHSLPTFTTEPGQIEGFTMLIVHHLEEDRAYWIAFSQAMDLCRNNRPITVGTD